MSSYVILLNWNGWKDTVECLESVFRLNYPNFSVVVCDNASGDGSAEKIKAWARGELRIEATNPELSHLTLPPLPKPLKYIELTRSEAETETAICEAPLILIQNGENLGFAGGNNVGIRYALRDQECQFCWILNNDTVVDPDALGALVREMQKCKIMGLCGSLILSYARPGEVQITGGSQYSRWTGRVRKQSKCLARDLQAAVAKIDYVNGASMLASRDFLMKVGLMEESYFLYFEEMDWAMRAKGKFSLGYARDSVLFHKAGATIGSSADRRKRSLLSERFLTRNRVLFTRRFYPWALPTVIVAITIAALEKIYRGDWNRGRTMFVAMAAGIREPISSVG